MRRRKGIAWGQVFIAETGLRLGSRVICLKPGQKLEFFSFFIKFSFLIPFYLLFNFFIVVLLQLSQVSPLCAPPPRPSPAATVHAHPVVRVCGSFTHVLWLVPSPSFSFLNSFELKNINLFWPLSQQKLSSKRSREVKTRFGPVIKKKYMERFVNLRVILVLGPRWYPPQCSNFTSCAAGVSTRPVLFKRPNM